MSLSVRSQHSPHVRRSPSHPGNSMSSPRGLSVTTTTVAPNSNNSTVGGFPRAQSLANDYNNQLALTTANNMNHNNTINNGNSNGNNNNNQAKLHHLLRFINHKPVPHAFDDPGHDAENFSSTENFFSGSKLVRELTDVTAKCMACVGDTVWIGEKNGVLSVWDLQTGDLIKRKEAQRNRTFVTSIAAVGLYVWVGYSDGLMRIYDPDTLVLLKEVKEHSGAINQLLLSYNGLSVYSASADFTIVQWDANSVERVAVLSGHKGGVKCMTTAVGLRLFSGGDDGTIIEWDVVRAKPRHFLSNHHRGSVRALAATAGHLWSGGEDGTVRLWSLTNNESAQQFQQQNNNNTTLNITDGSNTTMNGRNNSNNNRQNSSHTAVSPMTTPSGTPRQATTPRDTVPTAGFNNSTATTVRHNPKNAYAQQNSNTNQNNNNNHSFASGAPSESTDVLGHHHTINGVGGGGTTINNDSFSTTNYMQDIPSTNDQLFAAAPVCVHIITNPHTSAITALMIVGSFVWSASASRLFMWNAETFELEGAFSQKDGSGGERSGSSSSSMMSPNGTSSGFITCVSAVHQSVVARLWTCGSEGTVKMWNAESKWSSAFKAAQDEHVQRMELLLNANADREQQLEAGFEKMREATAAMKLDREALAAQLEASEEENAQLKAQLDEALHINKDQSDEIAFLHQKLAKLQKRLPQNKFEENMRSLLRGICQSHQDVFGAEEDGFNKSDDDNNSDDDDANDDDAAERNARRRRSGGDENEGDDDNDDLDSVRNYNRRFKKSTTGNGFDYEGCEHDDDGNDGYGHDYDEQHHHDEEDIDHLRHSSDNEDDSHHQHNNNNDDVNGQHQHDENNSSSAAAKNEQQKKPSVHDDDYYVHDAKANADGYSNILKPLFKAFDLVACAKLQAKLEELRQLHTDPFKGENEVLFRWRHGDYRYGDPKEFIAEDDEDDSEADDAEAVAANHNHQQSATSGLNGDDEDIINNNNNNAANSTTNNEGVPLTGTHNAEAQQNIIRLEMLALRVQVNQLNAHTSTASLELRDVLNADATTLREKSISYGNNPAPRAGSTSYDNSNSVAVDGAARSASSPQWITGDEQSDENPIGGCGGVSPRGGADGQSVGMATPMTPRRKAAAAVLASINAADDEEAAAAAGMDRSTSPNASGASHHNANGHLHASTASTTHQKKRGPTANPVGVALIDIDDLDEEDLKTLMNIKKRALLASADEAKAEKQRKIAQKKAERKERKKAKEERKRQKRRAQRKRAADVADDDEEEEDYDEDEDGTGSSSRSDSDDEDDITDYEDSANASDDDDDGLLGATTTLELVMKKLNKDANNANEKADQKKQKALQAILNLSDADMAALYMGPIPCPKTLNDNDKATLALMRLKYEAVATIVAAPSSSSSSKKAAASSSSSSVVPQMIAVRASLEAADAANPSTATLGYLTISELKPEEVETLKKLAKKYPSNSNGNDQNNNSKSASSGKAVGFAANNSASSGVSFPTVASARNTPKKNNSNSAFITRRVTTLEAIVARHMPVAVSLPPLAALQKKELIAVYSIYKKYRASIVDLKPEDTVLLKEHSERRRLRRERRAAAAANGNGYGAVSLNAENLRKMTSAAHSNDGDHHHHHAGAGGLHRSSSGAADHHHNNGDAKSMNSRRTGTTRNGANRAPKLYNPSKDYPALPSGVPAALLRLRADVESSLAAVLQQQTKTRNELTAMALELAEAKELLCENDELRQLLQEGEDKDEIRRARKAKKREEKEHRAAAKAAKKAAKRLLQTDRREKKSAAAEEKKAAKVNNNNNKKNNSNVPVAAVSASSAPAASEEQQQQYDDDEYNASNGHGGSSSTALMAKKRSFTGKKEEIEVDGSGAEQRPAGTPTVPTTTSSAVATPRHTVPQATPRPGGAATSPARTRTPPRTTTSSTAAGLNITSPNRSMQQRTASPVKTTTAPTTPRGTAKPAPNQALPVGTKVSGVLTPRTPPSTPNKRSGTPVAPPARASDVRRNLADLLPKEQ